MWSELSEAYGLWSDWSQDEKTSNIDKALKVRVRERSAEVKLFTKEPNLSSWERGYNLSDG